ncbi:MAG: hypothetical protein QOK28_2482 [Actinomycetota bacterium]|jgi:hypothetical protein
MAVNERDEREANDDTQNSAAGAILRPMMPLAERRKRDMETIAELEAEREAESGKRTQTRHIEAAITPQKPTATPPKRETPPAVDEADDAENTAAGAILRPMMQANRKPSSSH